MSITGQSGQGVVPPITGLPESQLHSVLQGNLASCKSFGGRRISPLAGLGLYPHEIPRGDFNFLGYNVPTV